MKTSKSSRGFAANLNRYPGDWGAICPAARMESLLEPRGARALIFVPRLACESIENVPFRTLSRSSILMRPSPRRCFAPQSLSWFQGGFNDPSSLKASATSTARVLSQVTVFEYLFPKNNHL
jgi:hypothetical protein